MRYPSYSIVTNHLLSRLHMKDWGKEIGRGAVSGHSKLLQRIFSSHAARAASSAAALPYPQRQRGKQLTVGKSNVAGWKPSIN